MCAEGAERLQRAMQFILFSIDIVIVLFVVYGMRLRIIGRFLIAGFHLLDQILFMILDLVFVKIMLIFFQLEGALKMILGHFDLIVCYGCLAVVVQTHSFIVMLLPVGVQRFVVAWLQALPARLAPVQMLRPAYSPQSSGNYEKVAEQNL